MQGTHRKIPGTDDQRPIIAVMFVSGVVFLGNFAYCFVLFPPEAKAPAFVQAITCVFLISPSLTGVAYGVRYELIDGAGGAQAGNTLEGFVEFDSPCGSDCTSENIIDFAFTVSGPSEYSYSFQSEEDVVFQDSPGAKFLFAGTRELLIDYNRVGGLGLGNAEDGYLRWQKFSTGTTSYDSHGPTGTSSGWLTVDGPLPNLGTVVIGTVVPEPSTAVVMVVALLTLVYAERFRY